MRFFSAALPFLGALALGAGTGLWAAPRLDRPEDIPIPVLTATSYSPPEVEIYPVPLEVTSEFHYAGYSNRDTLPDFSSDANAIDRNAYEMPPPINDDGDPVTASKEYQSG